MSRLLTNAGLQENAGLYDQGGIYDFRALSFSGESSFNPLSLNPYLFFDARDSMKNSSFETASFLQAIPALANLATGSNAGSNATQTTALKQPKALPLINGSGYVYLPNVTGNAPAVTFPNVPSSSNFVLTIVADIKNPTNFHFVTGVNSSHRFAIYSNQLFTPNQGGVVLTSAITTGLSTFVIERTGSIITLKQNGVTKATVTGNTNGFNITHISFNGQYGSTSIQSISGLVKSVVLTVEGTESVNIDFTDSTVSHGASSFTSGTGQTVTINKSGRDPAKIIRRPVLRFVTDAGSSLRGQLNRTITDGGYYFAVFSINGDGGSAASRVFSINSTNQNETANTGFVYAIKKGSENDLASYHGGYTLIHNDFYDEDKGSFLHEVKLVNNAQSSSVDNAGQITSNLSISNLSAEEFAIGCENNANQTSNPSIDLEFLALFNPNSIPNEQIAQKIRDYIANRATS